MKKFYLIVSVVLYCSCGNSDKQKEQEQERLNQSFKNAFTVDKSIQYKRDSINAKYADDKVFNDSNLVITVEK